MTVPSDYQMAQLSLAIYSGGAGFDAYTAGSDSPVFWGLKHFAGFDAVVFRGTDDLADFLVDASALAKIPVKYPALGPVHAGFYEGLEVGLDELIPQLRQPVVIGGHSLGAAHATLATGLLHLAGKDPVRRVVFGEPLSGFAQLASIVSRVPSASYCNSLSPIPLLHDPVTDVPLYLPPDELYLRAAPLTYVTQLPTFAILKSMGLLSMHSMDSYVTALQKRDVS